MKKTDRHKLTPKQEMFCREYLVNLNATQAAIRSGYSERTANEQGSRLLTKVSVQERIQELKKERACRVEVTADYVLTTIVDTIEKCKQAELVRDRRGEIVTVEDPDTGEMRAVYKYDAFAVLKGAELLGKHFALFTEKSAPPSHEARHLGRITISIVDGDKDPLKSE